jgi:hypothetical protein
VPKEITINLRKPHPRQQEFIDSKAKHKVIRAGRRSGKTVGIAILANMAFLDGWRVLYAAPTSEQTDRFWYEVKRALDPLIKTGIFKLNESENYIERPGTEQRIKCKTAWNSNTLRGDYARLLILDEFQLMSEDTWDEVGAPMLLDKNGDAVFIYTPPSLVSSGVSKARDPRHAAKMFKMALDDTTGQWQAFHFTSHDNPYIDSQALSLITATMSPDAYRREIMAEDDEAELSWLVYGKYQARTQTIDRFPIPNNWLIHTGHDFGSANPAALFIAQDPGTGNFYIYREYAPGGGLSAAQHSDKFKELTQGCNVIQRVGGNQTTEDEIRQAYTAHGWPITAPRLAKPNAQIDRVLGLMSLNKIFIFKDLHNLNTEIANCMWELDNDNKVTNKIKDEAKWHLLACLRYLGSNFTPETVLNSNRYATSVSVRRL